MEQGMIERRWVEVVDDEGGLGKKVENSEAAHATMGFTIASLQYAAAGSSTQYRQIFQTSALIEYVRDLSKEPTHDQAAV